MKLKVYGETGAFQSRNARFDDVLLSRYISVDWRQWVG